MAPARGVGLDPSGRTHLQPWPVAWGWTPVEGCLPGSEKPTGHWPVTSCGWERLRGLPVIREGTKPGQGTGLAPPWVTPGAPASGPRAPRTLYLAVLCGQQAPQAGKPGGWGASMLCRGEQGAVRTWPDLAGRRGPRELPQAAAALPPCPPLPRSTHRRALRLPIHSFIPHSPTRLPARKLSPPGQRLDGLSALTPGPGRGRGAGKMLVN